MNDIALKYSTTLAKPRRAGLQQRYMLRRKCFEYKTNSLSSEGQRGTFPKSLKNLGKINFLKSDKKILGKKQNF